MAKFTPTMPIFTLLVKSRAVSPSRVKTDTPFARNLALSHDPVQDFVYVGNGTEIAIVDRRSLEVVGTIKPPGMIGGGHQIAVDSKGNLYIAGTAAGLQKLTFKGMAVPK